MSTPVSTLRTLHACDESIAFASSFPDLETSWPAFQRGDWLVWFAHARGADIKVVTRIACECARLALPYTDNPLVLACIETTERWVEGTATLDEVKAARLTLKPVIDLAARAAASAAHVPDAAGPGAFAAGAASYADLAAAQNAANPEQIQTQIRLQCADIVRSHFESMP
jgi:hypothetical protein